jgi:aspartate-semialdehyde dehydrogenase
MASKVPVAVLGATGLVGQRLIQMLANHPWFEVVAVTGSERSLGQRYGEMVRWRLPGDPPRAAADLIVQPSEPGIPGRLAFSALPSEIAGEVELAFANAGYAVSSNAKNHRMAEDVPLIMAEVNPDHLSMIETQRRNRGWTTGLLITNSNCTSMPLTMALKPLDDAFGVTKVFAVSMQALSGAGYPGVASLDALDNVVPFIGGEEPKLEIEPRKMIGQLAADHGSVRLAPFIISAQTNRVAVRDGHLLSVSVQLQRKATPAEAAEVMASFRGRPQELGLPTAPNQPLIVRSEHDRPQPYLDRDAGQGMAISVGRVRECPLFDLRFVALGHNTIRGAAGAALLNGELLKAEGWL